MHRTIVGFGLFVKVFAPEEGGYLAVWAGGSEMKGEYDIDLICRWRIPDGKVQFVKVVCTNESEFKTLVKYLKACAKVLAKEITENADDLVY